MTDNKQTVIVKYRLGFLGPMFLIFMTLKLTGVINWSWWWVTAPLWGIPAFILGIALVSFLFLFLAELLSSGIKSIKRK